MNQIKTHYNIKLDQTVALRNAETNIRLAPAETIDFWDASTTATPVYQITTSTDRELYRIFRKKIFFFL